MAVVHDRYGSGDDVHPTLFREAAHQLDEARLLLGEISDLLLDRSFDIAQGQKLHGEILGKDEKMALVVRRRVDQGFDLVSELVECGHGPHVVLQGRYSNPVHASVSPVTIWRFYVTAGSSFSIAPSSPDLGIEVNAIERCAMRES